MEEIVLVYKKDESRNPYLKFQGEEIDIRVENEEWNQHLEDKARIYTHANLRYLSYDLEESLGGPYLYNSDINKFFVRE